MESRRKPDAGASDADRANLLRRLPSIQQLLERPEIEAQAQVPGKRGLVVMSAREEVEACRRAILSGRATEDDVSLASVSGRLLQRLNRDGRPLPRVLNATGVILHSGLGRAPLAPSVLDTLRSQGPYSLLEVDRERGERRARDTRCVTMLKALTGAEDGLVVNNNAAATVCILHALARKREVICSRGEMVEIGGSFRIPEVMEASGCELVSVGATNKTHIEDYARAIGPNTAALLVVHTSNYRIVGFTERPSLREIAELGHAHGLVVIHDLGSGSLLSPEALGIGDEPPVSASLEAGADVVCLSGDKMLGGPQAGIILGRSALVKECRSSPLARAFRIDKLRVAALEATLTLFLDPKTLDLTHPVTDMLRRKPADLRTRAEALVRAVAGCCPRDTVATIVPTDSEAGSGALPALPIPSLAVAITSPRMSPDALARALRLEPTPLFTKTRDGHVLLDVRTLADDEVELAATVLASALRRDSRASAN